MFVHLTGVAVALSLYLGMNFVCALALHLHAEKQAHLRHRVLDVVVHFVLLTAFALPVLAILTLDALFGSEKPQRVGKRAVISHA